MIVFNVDHYKNAYIEIGLAIYTDMKTDRVIDRLLATVMYT